MTMFKRVGIALLVVMIGLLSLDTGGRPSAPREFGFVSRAEAVVGRPLTPVSVAGVARRTARRCAVGVYDC
jgi:hypothetical protein